MGNPSLDSVGAPPPAYTLPTESSSSGGENARISSAAQPVLSDTEQAASLSLQSVEARDITEAASHLAESSDLPPPNFGPPPPPPQMLTEQSARTFPTKPPPLPPGEKNPEAKATPPDSPQTPVPADNDLEAILTAIKGTTEYKAFQAAEKAQTSPPAQRPTLLESASRTIVGTRNFLFNPNNGVKGETPATLEPRERALTANKKTGVVQTSSWSRAKAGSGFNFESYKMKIVDKLNSLLPSDKYTGDKEGLKEFIDQIQSATSEEDVSKFFTQHSELRHIEQAARFEVHEEAIKIGSAREAKTSLMGRVTSGVKTAYRAVTGQINSLALKAIGLASRVHTNLSSPKSSPTTFNVTMYRSEVIRFLDAAYKGATTDQDRLTITQIRGYAVDAKSVEDIRYYLDQQPALAYIHGAATTAAQPKQASSAPRLDFSRISSTLNKALLFITDKIRSFKSKPIQTAGRERAFAISENSVAELNTAVDKALENVDKHYHETFLNAALSLDLFDDTGKPLSKDDFVAQLKGQQSVILDRADALELYAAPIIAVFMEGYSRADQEKPEVKKVIAELQYAHAKEGSLLSETDMLYNIRSIIGQAPTNSKRVDAERMINAKLTELKTNETELEQEEALRDILKEYAEQTTDEALQGVILETDLRNDGKLISEEDLRAQLNDLLNLSNSN